MPNIYGTQGIELLDSWLDRDVGLPRNDKAFHAAISLIFQRYPDQSIHEARIMQYIMDKKGYLLQQDYPQDSFVRFCQEYSHRMQVIWNYLLDMKT